MTRLIIEFFFWKRYFTKVLRKYITSAIFLNFSQTQRLVRWTRFNIPVYHGTDTPRLCLILFFLIQWVTDTFRNWNHSYNHIPFPYIMIQNGQGLYLKWCYSKIVPHTMSITFVFVNVFLLRVHINNYFPHLYRIILYRMHWINSFPINKTTLDDSHTKKQRWPPRKFHVSVMIFLKLIFIRFTFCEDKLIF